MPDSIDEFFPWLRNASAEKWQDQKLMGLYGFQMQAGTKWLPGLTESEIDAFERDIGFCFPEIYKKFLRCMNGTDLPTINVYGFSGHPHRFSGGYYSYPRDIERIRDQLQWIYDSFSISGRDVEERGIPHVMPLVGHRFLVVDRCESNPVLSMYETDVIVYASSLRTFLVDDIFQGPDRETGCEAINVSFWLDE